MKKPSFSKISTLLAILLVICGAPATSQNLIPNPSFEDFIDFNSLLPSYWHKVQKTDTPDYFNFSGGSVSNDIFDKYIGGTTAKKGEGFIGLFFYRTSPQRNIKNVREYIQTDLLEQLQKDSIYRIEFSLCLDMESNIAIKNIGICFNQEPLINYSEYKLFTLKPQIEYSLSTPDCRNHWITFSSFYKASGTEKCLLLGNFKNDRNTPYQNLKQFRDKKKKEKWDLETSEKAAYYYFDDIVLEKITLKKDNPKDSLVSQNSEMNENDSIDIGKIPLDSSIVLQNIFFEFNKADLLPESFDELQKLFQVLKKNNTLRIKIEGHTDNQGSYDFNLQLSKKRAESVVLFLINKGIAADRIESGGFSYAIPIASNDTAEGRQLNRRVAFKIISK